MLLIYVDETGDPTGLPADGGSREYGLGVVVVEVAQWRPALDGMIAFRRTIRDRYGPPMTTEIKASYLVRNEGWFKGGHVRPSIKRRIYSEHMRVLDALGVGAFSVWIDKTGATPLPEVKKVLWDYFFQRIQRTYADRPFVLLHDDGDAKYIREHARRARRFLTSGQVTGGSRRLDVELLLDDPVPRNSQSSYFVQCADLVAYAAARAMRRGGARADRVCPPSMWNELGDARIGVVNYLARRSDADLPVAIVAKR